MADLYWLITLGSFSEVLGTISILSGILIAILSVILLVAWKSDIEEESKGFYKKWTKIVWAIWGIVTLIAIAIPTKQQFYLIYGVGGTIDYLKENPTAKQLPDKCIKVLDRWADEQLKEKE